MRISDWSSDVCSSDLATHSAFCEHGAKAFQSAHFADLLHRAFHFLMHFQEPVALLPCRAGTFGDPDLAFGIEQRGLGPLLRSHYADQGIKMDPRFVTTAAVRTGRRGFFSTWHHPSSTPHATPQAHPDYTTA